MDKPFGLKSVSLVNSITGEVIKTFAAVEIKDYKTGEAVYYVDENNPLQVKADYKIIDEK